MKLTAKLVAVFMSGIIVLTVINGWLRMRHEAKLFEEETGAEAQRIGSALEMLVVERFAAGGQEAVVQMIERANGEHRYTQIHWVLFDAPQSHPRHPQVPSSLLSTLRVHQEVAFTAQDPDGDPFLHAYWPIDLAPDLRSGLEISRSTSFLDKERRDTITRTLLLTGAMILIATLFTSLAGVRMVGRPLKRLTEKTRRVAAGDLTSPVQIKSRDELGELAQSLIGQRHLGPS